MGHPLEAFPVLLFQLNFKVHQLGAFRVVDAGDVEVCAFQGRVDVFDVEEEKSGLGGAGFDGAGGELGGFDLVAFFLTERAFHFFLRDGEREGMSVGVRIAQAAEDVFGGDGSEFGASGGGKGDLHVGDGDGLVAVVGNDEEDGKQAVLLKVDGEDFCFAGRVVGIGGDGDFFGGVIVVRGIGSGGMGFGLDEVFGGQVRGE